jgi:hypothetical protein
MTECIWIAVLCSIPKLAAEGARTDTGEGSTDSTLVNSTAKTRIPAPPEAPLQADVNNSRSSSRRRRGANGQLRRTVSNDELPAEAHAGTGSASACNSPEGSNPRQLQETSSAQLAGKSCNADPQQQLGQQQRPDLLQQHLKIAEAVRQSLEAELRDARFATSSWQTQVGNRCRQFMTDVQPCAPPSAGVKLVRDKRLSYN